MDLGNEGTIPAGAGEGEDVGRQAALEGMEAEFANLGQRLVQVHRRVQALTLAEPSESRDHELEVIKRELFEIFAESFLACQDTNPSKVFNFIMFLVDQISTYAYMKMRLGQAINAAGTELNTMAEVMGMKPLVGNVPPRTTGLVEDGTYITGTGQRLTNVHAADSCRGWCVIHNPLPGPWSDWQTDWRGDGPFDIWRGFERICPCGVGHTAMEHVFNGDSRLHACCGLCPCGPPMAQPVYDPDTQEIVGYQ